MRFDLLPALVLLTVAAHAQSHLFTHRGSEAQDQLGLAMSSAGDLDGDGRDELILAAPRSRRGYVRILSGRDGSILREHLAPSGSARFGHAVDGGIDVNGDDVPDYVVSDPYADQRKGRIWVYSGKDGAVLFTRVGAAGALLGYSAGLMPDFDGDKAGEFWAGEPRGGHRRGGAVYLWSGKTGLKHRHHESKLSGQNFGHSVAAGLDVNGDKVPDYAIASPGISSAGFVEIYSGKTGALLRRISGASSGSFFAVALALTPDIDGDGVAELAIGAPFGGRNKAGQVLLYSGKSGKLLRALSGAAAGGEFGFALAAAGDLNGDKLDELLVGAPAVQSRRRRVGAAFVYSGNYLRTGRGDRVLFSFVGEKDGDALGRSVLGRFDVDGDKVLDFAYSAIGADKPGVNTGAVYVRSSRARALACSGHQIVLSRGGMVEFSLDGGSANAGDLFLILGSSTGISPGSRVGSLQVPLVFDGYTNLLLGAPGALIAPSFGLFDSKGLASAKLSLPSMVAPGLVGLRLDHAYVVFEADGSGLSSASNSVPLIFMR
ncbi:MAG: hypothetical protein CSA62_12930 [Planctomycetota bacterium]|nr:MAG: hypothetical protein CSA62_12930 [Planctomycetota bacterium]